MTALVTMPAIARNRRKGRPDAAGDMERLEAVLLQACRPAVLSAEGAHALAAEGMECAVRAGEAVFSRDDAATDLWLVLEGRVALGGRNGGGQLQQRRCVEAGGWLDLASALLHGAHLEDAEAQTDARLCQLPLHAVLRSAKTHPCVMPALATAMAGELALLVDSTRGLMTKDVLARCATWLLDHARMDAPNGDRRTGTVQLLQRKRAVAQELGTTAETFSRTLGHLSRTGLIDVRGYAIALLDVHALEQLARRT